MMQKQKSSSLSLQRIVMCRLVQSKGNFQAAFCQYYDLPTAQAARRNLDGALVQEVPVIVRFTVEVPSQEVEEGKENGTCPFGNFFEANMYGGGLFMFEV